MKNKIAILIGFLTFARLGFSQAFINLDFESANLSAYGAGPASVPAANAIPGWTAYALGSQQTQIIYNSVGLGGPVVSIHSTNDVFPPIQGKYFIFLQGDSTSSGLNASIGQTAQVPLNAKTVIFWGTDFGSTESPVSFAGQDLAWGSIGVTGNYTVYQADISPYAGQTGELLFTGFSGGGLFLDNIQFSPNPVPEPDTLALTGLGITLLGFRCRNKSLP